MMAVVKNAHENLSSTVYDEFQRVSDTWRPVEIGLLMAWRDARAL
jgi:hypothetical protein